MAEMCEVGVWGGKGGESPDLLTILHWTAQNNAISLRLNWCLWIMVCSENLKENTDSYIKYNSDKMNIWLIFLGLWKTLDSNAMCL